jgi:hypothetical protein
LYNRPLSPADVQQIYKSIDHAHPQNLFLIVYLGGRPQDYVQCVFDTRTEMLCEAASGYFDSKPDEPRAYRLPARSIDALGRLGFSTDDSANNFQIWFDVPEPPDLNRIADFILKRCMTATASALAANWNSTRRWRRARRRNACRSVEAPAFFPPQDPDRRQCSRRASRPVSSAPICR